MDKNNISEFKNLYSDAQVINFPEPVTEKNFREFPEMEALIDNNNGQLQIRTHATNVDNAISMINPDNVNNGLIIYTYNLDSTTLVLTQSDPYLGLSAHKRAKAMTIIKTPREFTDPGKDVSRGLRSGVRDARIEALIENLPKVIENGKEYPKLPIETIYGVLIGEPDTTGVFMRFNSLILNPHFAPDKLLEIIHREHPDYDPNKIVESLGRVGGMWGYGG